MTPDAGMVGPANAAVARTEPARGAADFAWLIDEGLLLLVGAADAALPARGDIQPAEGGPAGTIGAIAWNLRTEAGDPAATHGFVALAQMENVAGLRPERIDVTVEGAVAAVLSVRRLQLDQDAALKRLAAIPPAMACAAWHLLAAVPATPATGERAKRIGAMLAALLRQSSKPDGYLERAGIAEDGGLVFEGWTTGLAAGMKELVVEADGLVCLQGAVGLAPRQGLPPEAAAVVGYARGETPFDARRLQRLYYATADGFRHLAPVEKGWQLPAERCIPHLRAMLGRISTDAEAMRRLKRACRPRFQGVETISSFPHPVRATVDLAVAAPDAGLFLSGWLLDPRRQVMRVILRGTDGFYARIDDQWGRLTRADVVEALREDPVVGPALGAASGNARHGFAVFVPRPNVAQGSVAYWLEIVLLDDSCAFLPFTALDGRLEPVADRLMTCLDPRDAAARAVVERHLAPIAAAVMRRAERAPEPQQVVPIGLKRDAGDTPRLSIVIPALGQVDDIDINLACLAGEPAALQAELIVVAGEDSDATLSGRLDHYARFYGFGGRLATLPRAPGRHDALEAGAALAAGDALLFLSPDVLPRGAGWLGQLVRSFRAADRAGLVSPTLLYEDDSIRFAGMPMAEMTQDAPPPAGPGRYAGYPRDWIANAPPAEVLAGTSECCLIPRRLFQRVGGFARDLSGGPQQDIELGMRLRNAGRHCLWVPSIALYAVDPAARAALPAHGATIARMVDDWSFARSWERRTAARPEAAE